MNGGSSLTECLKLTAGRFAGVVRLTVIRPQRAVQWWRKRKRIQTTSCQLLTLTPSLVLGFAGGREPSKRKMFTTLRATNSFPGSSSSPPSAATAKILFGEYSKFRYHFIFINYFHSLFITIIIIIHNFIQHHNDYNTEYLITTLQSKQYNRNIIYFILHTTSLIHPTPQKKKKKKSYLLHSNFYSITLIITS